MARSGKVILLLPDHADALDASRRAQLQRGMHGARGVSGPVADLAGAEIEEAAPVIGHVLRAERPHGAPPSHRSQSSVSRHGLLGRQLLQARRVRAGRGRDVRLP